jgi:hypothetical protein
LARVITNRTIRDRLARRDQRPHLERLPSGVGEAPEHHRTHELRFDIAATNLFNHTNYSPLADGSLNISQAAQVGVLSGVGNTSDLDLSGARSFRASIRFEW